MRLSKKNKSEVVIKGYEMEPMLLMNASDKNKSEFVSSGYEEEKNGHGCCGIFLNIA